MYVHVYIYIYMYIYIYIFYIYIYIYVCIYTYLVSSSVILFKTWEKYVGFKDRLAFAHSNFSQV